MMQDARTPLILGTGLTGLAISRHLSRSGISHFIVGPPPRETPRLGESLDITGTVLFKEDFPEFQHLTHRKRAFVFHLGTRETHCSLEFARRRSFSRFFKVLGHRPPEALLHIDRSRLDPELYDLVTSEFHCTAVPEKVQEVHYDAATDSIESVTTESGAKINTSWVFDAGSPMSPVTCALGLTPIPISSPQRTSFAHFTADGPVSGNPTWHERTELVCMAKEIDGLSGMIWCIPLGNKLSLGISIEADEETPDADLIETALRACERRGLRILDHLPHRTEAVHVSHRYFKRERVSGANWLLAGSPAAQVWFMSGSGVGVGLLAARIAPDCVRGKEKIKRQYAAYVEGLTRSHGCLSKVRYGNYGASCHRTLHAAVDPVVHSNVRRTAMFGKVTRSLPGYLFGMTAYKLSERRLILRNYCTILQNSSLRNHAREHLVVEAAGALRT